MYTYDPKGKCRYGFLRKDDLDRDRVVWINTPTHFVFHYLNSWEEVNKEGEQLIIIYGISWSKVDVTFECAEHPFLGTSFG
mmetsp:Transcript_1072/g.1984  ORF Transcript_1072/g.1984 Transcript_1072/m.1984 type:complete len:81 (-) Transcript_1072:565-807(-)